MGRRDRRWTKDDPRWTMPQKPAPGELRIVQALVNTAPMGKRTDGLANPGALAGWLERWGLVAGGTEIDDAELETMREVRAALRAMVAANRAGDPPHDAFEILNRIADEALLKVRFHAGDVILQPGSGGLDGALAKVFAIVALAQHDDLWRRLRLCLDEECGSAFFDYFGDLSTKWCNPSCRVRHASRAYRRRRKLRGL